MMVCASAALGLTPNSTLISFRTDARCTTASHSIHSFKTGPTSTGIATIGQGDARTKYMDICYAHVHRHQNRYLHVRVLETSRAEVSITIPSNSKRLTAHSVCKNILLQKCTPHKEQPQLNAMSIPWHRATVSKKSRCIPATFFDLTMRVGLGVGCV